MRQLVQDILSQADIVINGTRPWDITVHNEEIYSKLIANPEMALGETYVEKAWDCQRLDQFFYKVLRAKFSKQLLKNIRFWRAAIRSACYKGFHYLLNDQTKIKSLMVGRRHYDIGNDLYNIMLDKRLVYTCGYWNQATTLDQAQENKLKLTCQKLNLEPGMKVLDIGCGWGSFAKYAAENYGVSVKGITISEQQRLLGQTLCKDLPVDLELQDYRDLIHTDVKYDRIVSLGMFEHVGYKNYPHYMKAVAHCLKRDGIFLLHTIGSNRTNIAPNMWINAYVFQTGHLPSIQQIGKAIENIFVMEDWQNFGFDYDKTLMAWYDNFNANWDQIKNVYSEKFKRLWNYYLLSCAGSFRARDNQLWQIVLTKDGFQQGYQRSWETLNP